MKSIINPNPTVSIEHCGDCQCDTCLDVASSLEPTLPDSDAPLTTLAMDVADAGALYVKANDNFTALTTVATALEDLFNSFSAVPVNQEYIPTPEDGVVLHDAVGAIHGLVMDVPSQERMLPALECFVSDPKEALVVSIESIGEWLKKLWEAIKHAMHTLYNSILNVLRKLINYNGGLRRQATRNSQEVARLVAMPPHGPIVSGFQVKTRLDPITDLDLSEGAIRALWLPSNNKVTTNLFADISKYKNMFVNGFITWTEHQRQTDAATRNILENVIRRAHIDLDRGRKKDEKIAKDIASYAGRKLSESAGVLETQKVKLLTPFVGSYLGGIAITVDPKAVGFFSKLDITPSHSAKIPVISLPELSKLTNLCVDLSVSYELYISGAYQSLGELLNNTTNLISKEVDELSNNYSDFPELLKMFQVALKDNESVYTHFLNTVYKVIQTTSKLCAVMHGEVIPGYIEALQP